MMMGEVLREPNTGRLISGGSSNVECMLVVVVLRSDESTKQWKKGMLFAFPEDCEMDE